MTNEETACSFAPLDHDAPAIVQVAFRWQCGHLGIRNSDWIPTCSDHLLRIMQGPGRSENQSLCEVCEERSYRVVRAVKAA